MDDYEFHEVSAIFPLMEGDRFAELVADIKERGLRDPITLKDGKIVDGRNRYRACKDAGVEPKFEQWNNNGSSLTDFVISRNRYRRHLDMTDLALAAARASPHYEAEAKNRQVATLKRGKSKPVPDSSPERGVRGESTELAGKAFGISGKSVARAKRVLDKGSDKLQQAVQSKRLAIATAAKLVDLSKSQQNKILDEGKSAIKQAVSQPKSQPHPRTQAAPSSDQNSMTQSQIIDELIYYVSLFMDKYPNSASDLEFELTSMLSFARQGRT